MALGGARPGAGRPKGVPNKSTADVKALAMQHVPAAILELARIASQGESEAARVAAVKELLDRAVGKARQPITGGDEGDQPIQQVIRWALSDREGTADPSAKS